MNYKCIYYYMGMTFISTGKSIHYAMLKTLALIEQWRDEHNPGDDFEFRSEYCVMEEDDAVDEWFSISQQDDEEKMVVKLSETMTRLGKTKAAEINYRRKLATHSRISRSIKDELDELWEVINDLP